jgi:hypothetical protein
MVGKPVQFDADTWEAIELSCTTAARAFTELLTRLPPNLLKEHDQPIGGEQDARPKQKEASGARVEASGADRSCARNPDFWKASLVASGAFSYNGGEHRWICVTDHLVSM